MQGLKSVRKIVYAKVHRWSKDCLSRETNAVFPTLRSRTNSFRNDSSKQKIFHLLAWKLRDECPAFVSVEIICFEHLQQGSYEKLNLWIFLQDYLRPNTSSCKHDASLEDDYCVPFFDLKFLIPTLLHMFRLPKPTNIYGQRDFISSVSWNKLEKYTFLWFKKRDFDLWWEKNITEFFQENMLSSSLVDIIFLRTSLL